MAGRETRSSTFKHHAELIADCFAILVADALGLINVDPAGKEALLADLSIRPSTHVQGPGGGAPTRSAAFAGMRSRSISAFPLPAGNFWCPEGRGSLRRPSRPRRAGFPLAARCFGRASARVGDFGGPADTRDRRLARPPGAPVSRPTKKWGSRPH